ncbi:MAG: ABC transporter ATP-binding protein [Deinococcales bacterium]
MATSKQSLLSIKHISKAFGSVQAVKDVSFEVFPGEILGVIGPNGCGKSTLFNCILGQLTPDKGQVVFKGQQVSGWLPSKLALSGLGRTFQLLQVFPSMSVRENLLVAAQAHKGNVLSRLFMPPDMGLMPKVDAMIEAFRLGHLADEEAGRLSYGQQKLLDIAMPLMSGSGVVFLDEPAGGVNLSMLAGVKDLLLRLNREQQVTIVVIEHNMEFIFEVAHRIVVMSEGSVLMIGTPETVRRDPKVIEAYLGH